MASRNTFNRAGFGVDPRIAKAIKRETGSAPNLEQARTINEQERRLREAGIRSADRPAIIVENVLQEIQRRQQGQVSQLEKFRQQLEQERQQSIPIDVARKEYLRRNLQNSYQMSIEPSQVAGVLNGPYLQSIPPTSEELIKSQSIIDVNDNTGTISGLDGNYNIINNTPIDNQTFQENKSQIQRFGERIYEGIASPVRGGYQAGKTVLPLLSPLGLISLTQEEKRQEVVNLYKNPDVQSLLAIEGLIALDSVAPVLGSITVGGIATYSTSETLKDPSPENLADTTLLLTPYVPKALKTIKGIGNMINAEYIPAEKVVDPLVLAGKKIFPTVKNWREVIPEFKKTRDAEGYLRGIHATISKFKSETEAGGTRRLGRELSGIYMSALGRASSYFLGLNKLEKKYNISLNPFKNLLSNPNFVVVKFKDIRAMPKKILNSDLATQQKFTYEQALKNKILYVPADTVAGKPELQTVIPQGIKIFRDIRGNILQNLRGSKYYTIIEGEIIPIRDYAINDFKKLNSKKLNKLIERVRETQFKKDSRNLYSYGGKEDTITIPVSSSTVYSPSRNILNIPSSGPVYSKPSSSPLSIGSSIISSRSGSSSNLLSTPSSPKISSPPSSPPSTPPSTPPSYPPSTPPSTPPSYPPSTPPSTPPSYPPSYLKQRRPSSRKSSKTGALLDAYRLQVLEKGRYRNVGKPDVLGKILKKGVDIVDNSLLAQFRALKTNKKIAGTPYPYKVNPVKFRDYKIRKGKKISTPLNFIEKRAYRLDSPNERRSLGLAKKSAPKKTIRTKNMNFLK